VLLALALKGRFELDDDACDAGVEQPDDDAPDHEEAGR
jgi:hypothetical protein